MMVRQNIAYPLEVRKQSRNEVAARVEEILFIAKFRIFTLPRRMWEGIRENADPTPSPRRRSC